MVKGIFRFFLLNKVTDLFFEDTQYAYIHNDVFGTVLQIRITNTLEIWRL